MIECVSIMNFSIDDVKLRAISYFRGDPRRIHHLLKVHSYGKTIAQSIGFNKHDLTILEITLLLHDVGIKKGEEIHHSSNAIYQEKYGPECALEILQDLDIKKEDLDHIAFMIAHHHSYSGISDISLQVLVEADFLVNAYEDNMTRDAIINVRDSIFKNDVSKKILNDMFNLD